MPFPELEEERDRAERVKQETPVLVILGNPPYNGFAGMAVDEERSLSDAYRTTQRVRRPEGQGLNDLYVRFFRMAERRIAEKTGQGVVCFISNYSWLDGLSFTGMRERFLEAFDAIRVDCLNGDKYKTGKVAPDGSPDPSIFSTESDPVGIQVGTAVATLVRKAVHAPANAVGFRHLWGRAKPAELTETAEEEPGDFVRRDRARLAARPAVRAYRGERRLVRLAGAAGPVSGVVSRREDQPRRLSGGRGPRPPQGANRRLLRPGAEPRGHGATLSGGDGTHGALRRTRGAGGSAETWRAGRVRLHALLLTVRSTDRWLYWEADTKLLDEKRADYMPHVFEGNVWLSASAAPSQGRGPDLSPQAGDFTGHLAFTSFESERIAVMYCLPTLVMATSDWSPNQDNRNSPT